MTFKDDKPLAYAKMQKFDDMLKEGKSIAIMQGSETMVIGYIDKFEAFVHGPHISEVMG